MKRVEVFYIFLSWNKLKKEQMDCVLFASPVHIVTAWPIAPQKQGYNIVRVGRGGAGKVGGLCPLPTSFDF